jgi:ribosomal protein S21
MIIVKNKSKRIDYALKEYRKKVKKYKLHEEVKSKRQFTKKSEKRRAEKQNARYRNEKSRKDI